MTKREALLAAARERILLTDGAFGTEIQNWKLSEADYAGDLGLAHDQKGNNDILALTMPEVPESIHRAYFEAGADIAETNTFSANRISQADYGAEHLVRDLNLAAAGIARRAADAAQAKDSVLLGILALTGTVTGAWAYFAPRHWYDTFPGMGMSWLPQLGPYNWIPCGVEVGAAIGQ